MYSPTMFKIRTLVQLAFIFANGVSLSCAADTNFESCMSALINACKDSAYRSSGESGSQCLERLRSTCESAADKLAPVSAEDIKKAKDEKDLDRKNTLDDRTQAKKDKELAKKEKIQSTCNDQTKNFSDEVNDQKAFCSTNPYGGSCPTYLNRCTDFITKAEQNGLWGKDPSTGQWGSGQNFVGPCGQVLLAKNADAANDLRDEATKKVADAKDQLQTAKDEELNSRIKNSGDAAQFQESIAKQEESIDNLDIKLKSDILGLRDSSDAETLQLSTSILGLNQKARSLVNVGIPAAEGDFQVAKAKALAECTRSARKDAKDYEEQTAKQRKLMKDWGVKSLNALASTVGIRGTSAERIEYYNAYYLDLCMTEATQTEVAVAKAKYQNTVNDLKMQAQEMTEQAALLQKQIDLKQASAKTKEDLLVLQAARQVQSTVDAMARARANEGQIEQLQAEKAYNLYNRMQTLTQQQEEYNQRLAVLPTTKVTDKNYQAYTDAVKAQGKIDGTLAATNNAFCCVDKYTGLRLNGSGLCSEVKATLPFSSINLTAPAAR